MGQADSLSRRVDWAERVEKDNENQEMLKRKWLEIRAMDRKQWLIEGVKEKAGIKVLRNKEWQIEDNLVLKEEKVYMPRDKKLRLDIMQLHHDTPITEHGG